MSKLITKLSLPLEKVILLLSNEDFIISVAIKLIDSELSVIKTLRYRIFRRDILFCYPNLFRMLLQNVCLANGKITFHGHY
jgi:hypothetical protein